MPPDHTDSEAFFLFIDVVEYRNHVLFSSRFQISRKSVAWHGASIVNWNYLWLHKVGWIHLTGGFDAISDKEKELHLCQRPNRATRYEYITREN